MILKLKIARYNSDNLIIVKLGSIIRLLLFWSMNNLLQLSGSKLGASTIESGD